MGLVRVLFAGPDAGIGHGALRGAFVQVLGIAIPRTLSWGGCLLGVSREDALRLKTLDPSRQHTTIATILAQALNTRRVPACMAADVYFSFLLRCIQTSGLGIAQGGWASPVCYVMLRKQQGVLQLEVSCVSSQLPRIVRFERVTLFWADSEKTRSFWAPCWYSNITETRKMPPNATILRMSCELSVIVVPSGRHRRCSWLRPRLNVAKIWELRL